MNLNGWRGLCFAALYYDIKPDRCTDLLSRSSKVRHSSLNHAGKVLGATAVREVALKGYKA